jgi:carbon-monoxide dehydrogenase medium subunit
MAGGMSLIPLMKMRLFSPGLVVDIGRIPGLDGVDDTGDYLEIGALVRHATTASSDVISAHAQALATAASLTGDVQVRNRGTTCGALAHADVAADQPAGALACGAVMVVGSGSGTREIPASEFFVDTLTSALEPNEILTSIRIPKAVPARHRRQVGSPRWSPDYAVAGSAAWVKSPTAQSKRPAPRDGRGTKPQLAEGVAEALIAQTDRTRPWLPPIV